MEFIKVISFGNIQGQKLYDEKGNLLGRVGELFTLERAGKKGMSIGYLLEQIEDNDIQVKKDQTLFLNP